jgi:hypothetical protein
MALPGIEPPSGVEPTASTMLPRAPVNIPLKEDIGQFLTVFLADS